MNIILRLRLHPDDRSRYEPIRDEKAAAEARKPIEVSIPRCRVRGAQARSIAGYGSNVNRIDSNGSSMSQNGGGRKV